MGLLSSDTSLTWEEIQECADYIREHGITQFLNLWREQKDRESDPLLWGDEIEYMVVFYDNQSQSARLSLRQNEILHELHKSPHSSHGSSGGKSAEFDPEYTRYQLESAPGAPYDSSMSDLLVVERNMRYRRERIRGHLSPQEVLVTVSSFPSLGAAETFTEPPIDPGDPNSRRSSSFPDEIISHHTRYRTLTDTFQRRRGSKATANIPVFFDISTPRPFLDPMISWERDAHSNDYMAQSCAAKPDHIYLDSMSFGPSSCCLQVTLQAPDVNAARSLYDALVVIAPIMLPLTASSPAYRGYLSDVDCRWEMLTATLDDRTEEELGLKPLEHNKHVILKSRYGSVNLFISSNPNNRPEYNDIPFPIDETSYRRLREGNIDDLFAKHISHLFVRDPLMVYTGSLEGGDDHNTDLLESVLSSHWPTVRFKLPTADGKMGWRVELRTMEVQPTDFENASFAVFITLLSHAILQLGVNLYVPISKVDENMSRAQKRDAVKEGRFWFRKHVWPKSYGTRGVGYARSSELDSIEEEFKQMTIDEIINGKESFPGFLGIVNAYLDSLKIESDAKLKLNKYLNLIKRRANGSLQTPAAWIRDFVRAHPAYNFDSVISQQINYDIIKAIEES